MQGVGEQMGGWVDRNANLPKHRIQEVCEDIHHRADAVVRVLEAKNLVCIERLCKLLHRATHLLGCLGHEGVDNLVLPHVSTCVWACTWTCVQAYDRLLLMRV